MDSAHGLIWMLEQRVRRLEDWKERIEIVQENRRVELIKEKMWSEYSRNRPYFGYTCHVCGDLKDYCRCVKENFMRNITYDKIVEFEQKFFSK